ncbi:hypothetical protein BUE80_DR005580 [Diplocarpon rosae]|nr:hypothetical protein BUE80_DR005580 [Diplocarpon rosae]
MTDTKELEKPVYEFESLGPEPKRERSQGCCNLRLHSKLPQSQLLQDRQLKLSKSFVFENSAHGAAIFNMTAEAYCYSRIANPTVTVLETRMAALEGGEAALATSSGAAALLTTITALAQRGSNIVVASQISVSTSRLFQHRLKNLGISARIVVDGHAEHVSQAIDDETKFVFAESVPIDDLLATDIEALAVLAHSKGLPLVVDNTAGAGGFLIRPIDHGADVVVQDAGPWLSISGSSSAGIIVDSGKFDWAKSTRRFPQFFEPSPGFHGLKIWEKFKNKSFVAYARAAVMRDAGPCLNPFEAFQLIAGLETLAVRVERISSNAIVVAKWIEGIKDERHGGVVAVSYPGLSLPFKKRGHGGVLSVVLEDSEALQRLCSKTTLVSIGQSIGGSRTIIVPRYSSSDNARSDGKPQAWISVGLENQNDILKDLEHAFSDSG